jgi:hypothetical protein
MKKIEIEKESSSKDLADLLNNQSVDLNMSVTLMIFSKIHSFTEIDFYLVILSVVIWLNSQEKVSYAFL